MIVNIINFLILLKTSLYLNKWLKKFEYTLNLYIFLNTQGIGPEMLSLYITFHSPLLLEGYTHSEKSILKTEFCRIGIESTTRRIQIERIN